MVIISAFFASIDCNCTKILWDKEHDMLNKSMFIFMCPLTRQYSFFLKYMLCPKPIDPKPNNTNKHSVQLKHYSRTYIALFYPFFFFICVCV